ncbi:hypothetical protein PISMIDRAFT_459618 [Pisolithus microcarpus 441]|uniref:Unplaced genomic scaffold scaffold_42, whole genome shotgun sequence n=1 Tax=Pisolithus microcarpus 441 TaxID=765257 RepID=A0A0C9ZUP7_9AGAM|nr:hypothetical protein PISMIDRAFT_459618 [Pisolithus microcarpus 441]
MEVVAMTGLSLRVAGSALKRNTPCLCSLTCPTPPPTSWSLPHVSVSYSVSRRFLCS